MHLMSFYSTQYVSKHREENILKKLNLTRCLWFISGISLGIIITYLLVSGGSGKNVTENTTEDTPQALIAQEASDIEGGMIVEMSAEDAIRASMVGDSTQSIASKTHVLEGEISDNIGSAGASIVTETPISWPQTVDVTINSGDTLITLLIHHGMERVAAHRLCKEINKIYNLRDLNLGQKVTLVLDEDTSREVVADETTSSEMVILPATLQKLTLDISKLETLEVTSKGGEVYDIKRVKKKLLTDRSRVKAVIYSSLYGAAEQQGVPREAISQLIKNFSYEVDFQRDIKSGDVMDMMYETKKTEDGEVVESGDIVYAMLKTNGRVHTQYRFLNDHGLPAYYNEKGESIVKRLLRTPIDGARLSSGFGMRRHPILGYSKMHTGIDFAAVRGTPIFASGDGVVSFAGYNGSYGKFVRIKHNDTFSTAYAHAHRIAPTVRKGAFVHQGQVIAYVGTTGRSTGPHLHYEILKNGVQVNPLLVKMTGNDKLQGNRLVAFKQHVHTLQTQLAHLKPNAESKAKLALLQ